MIIKLLVNAKFILIIKAIKN